MGTFHHYPKWLTMPDGTARLVQDRIEHTKLYAQHGDKIEAVPKADVAEVPGSPPNSRPRPVKQEYPKFLTGPRGQTKIVKDAEEHERQVEAWANEPEIADERLASGSAKSPALAEQAAQFDKSWKELSEQHAQLQADHAALQAEHDKLQQAHQEQGAELDELRTAHAALEARLKEAQKAAKKEK